MAKMTLNPNKKKVDEFINRAGETPNGYPWTEPQVREDMVKLVSLRLSEPEYLKWYG